MSSKEMILPINEIAAQVPLRVAFMASVAVALHKPCAKHLSAHVHYYLALFLYRHIITQNEPWLKDSKVL